MTPTKSLFPEAPEDFPPASDRREPIVWVRRLVVVERRETGITPIREIEFRRGLNIIATEQPNPNERRPVGHNVGKTLLTRLIRYCLGEQYFAAETTRKIIAAKLPESYVLAEIVLDGSNWAVARPIGEDRSADAWCAQTGGWRDLLGDVSGLDRYPVFTDAIEAATVNRFSDLILPHQARSVRWNDVLAWLSRDQYCRYRNPVEWRSSHTGSNTPDLHFEDASLLIRVVMDLLDNKEKKLVAAHKLLLRDHEMKVKELRRQESDLQRTKEFLERRLRMPEDQLSDDLFGSAAKAAAEQHTNDLREQLKKLNEDPDLVELAAGLKAADDAVTRKDQEITTRRADQQRVEGELKQHQSATKTELVASFADLANPCSLPPGQCPLKNAAQKPGELNPMREYLINERTAELQRLDQIVTLLSSELVELQFQATNADLNYRLREAELAKHRDTVARELARLNALVDEANDFATTFKSAKTLGEAVASLEADIEASRGAHLHARAEVARRQKTLNAHFNRVLSALVGGQPQGRIDINMKGLHLSLDSDEAAQGEGLATAELVLSLDLACLSAAICGLGNGARLLIHDSPREGDLELHIYFRLFEFIASLEKSFQGREPSFQYIVTTTTAPPEELAVKPYVRDTLHARDKDGLLLRVQF